MLANESLEICRTPHWILRHSAEAAIPGYLVLSSVHSATSLGDLPNPASAELGRLLQESVKAVEAVVQPERVYLILLNESYSAVHFHVFPRMDWMKQFTPDGADPAKLIDGGVVFSAARKARSGVAEIRAAETQIRDAASAIRALITRVLYPESVSRL